MRRFLTLIYLLLAAGAMAQPTYQGFDDTSHLAGIRIDTSYHRNNWQIGRPNKTVFTSPMSSPNVMITDTSHAYSAGDTSVFVAQIPLGVYCAIYDTLSWLYDFQFYYQLNIDSDAHAYVEMSIDKGRHWLNTHDSLITGFGWRGGPARLDTSTGGWTIFGLSASYYPPHDTDTVYFRFTFITDSGATGHDGWMIDNLDARYWCEGAVHAVSTNDILSLFPNPSDGCITLQISNQVLQPGSVCVRNMMGQAVYTKTGVHGNDELRMELPPGVYLLQYTSPGINTTKQIVIKR